MYTNALHDGRHIKTSVAKYQLPTYNFIHDPLCKCNKESKSVGLPSVFRLLIDTVVQLSVQFVNKKITFPRKKKYSYEPDEISVCLGASRQT